MYLAQYLRFKAKKLFNEVIIINEFSMKTGSQDLCEHWCKQGEISYRILNDFTLVSRNFTSIVEYRYMYKILF